LAKRTVITLTWIAASLAFVVVMLGAFTRLTQAGLGCPDWPGCYGHAIVPKIAQAAVAFPAQPLETTKAWTEMTHRYFAGSLALLILLLAGSRLLKATRLPPRLPFVLVGLVVMQALLGMWTVTLKLWPIVVMAHLLGGMATLALLWWLVLLTGNYARLPPAMLSSKIILFARIGLLVIVCQIILGGWTSANYAALICPDFPTCHGSLAPPMDWQAGFNLLHAPSAYLSGAAGTAVQMMHRLGALITALYLGSLAMVLWRTRLSLLRTEAIVLLALLAVQIQLGISNVLKLLPLPIAVGHNAVAALLLLTVVTINHTLSKKSELSCQQ
jgi:heme a synthase